MILAIDQGTTGTTCMVFDTEAEVLGRAYREFEQHFPRPGWVEHDPQEIWRNVLLVVRVALDKGTTAAGVLTRSRCPSAPVEWCRARLAAGAARGLVVNSGNANAFTGKNGREAVKLTADIAA